MESRTLTQLFVAFMVLVFLLDLSSKTQLINTVGKHPTQHHQEATEVQGFTSTGCCFYVASLVDREDFLSYLLGRRLLQLALDSHDIQIPSPSDPCS